MTTSDAIVALGAVLILAGSFGFYAWASSALRLASDVIGFLFSYQENRR